jgi:hypothetical protein
MATTVFILGAGASHEGGAPLMAEFLDVARELRVGNEKLPFANSFDIVFNAISALQKVHSKAQLDIRNIESVLPRLRWRRSCRCWVSMALKMQSRFPLR